MYSKAQKLGCSPVGLRLIVSVLIARMTGTRHLYGQACTQKASLLSSSFPAECLPVLESLQKSIYSQSIY